MKRSIVACAALLAANAGHCAASGSDRTWSGPVGGLWGDANWDGGELFADDDNAFFVHDGDAAAVAAPVVAAKVTATANATVSAGQADEYAACQYYRFKIVANRGGGVNTQLSDVALYGPDGRRLLRDVDYTLSWDSTTTYNGATFNSGEAPWHAVDVDASGAGDLGTKWLDKRLAPDAPQDARDAVWLQFTFSGPVLISGYSWSTGNDHSERDPVSWQLLASDDGSDWFEYDSVENADVTTARKALAYRVHYPPTEAVLEVGQVEVSAGGTLTIGVPVTAPATLEKLGGGTLVLENGTDSPLRIAGGAVVARGCGYNPFSSAKDALFVGGLLDIGGSTQWIHVSKGPNFLGDGAVFTNGTFMVDNDDRWMNFPPGLFTVAKGAALVFRGSIVDKNMFNAGKVAEGSVRLLVDGGEVTSEAYRNTNGTGHYWGNDYALSAVLEVANGGYFCLEHVDDGSAGLRHDYFGLGGPGAKTTTVSALVGRDSPERGFRFNTRVMVGETADARIAMTNCRFRADHIVLGGALYASSAYRGHAALSFAGGSVVETKGFYGGYLLDTPTVVFDGAKAVVLAQGAGDALRTHGDFFGVTEDHGASYVIAAGGLEWDNGGFDVTNRTALAGEGGLTLSGGGRTTLSVDQLYTGATTVKSGTTLSAAGRSFAGPVVVESGAILERPAIGDGVLFVKVMSAPSFSGAGISRAESYDPATGRGYFVLNGWLCYGKVSGMTMAIK